VILLFDKGPGTLEEGRTEVKEESLGQQIQLSSFELIMQENVCRKKAMHNS
jgi:hypothetical protein